MTFGDKGERISQFKNPTGIAVDKKGRIYVADSGNNRIQIFRSNGDFLRVFGKKGAGRGKFDNPTDLDIDKRDRLYVLDSGNNRILVFNLDGRFVAEIGTKGKENGQFREPLNMTIDSMGHIYVSDTGNNRLQELALGEVEGVSIGKDEGGDVPKLRMAVLDFRNNNREATGYGFIISDMFTTALVQTGCFELVERKELQKILGEQTLSQSGALKDVQNIGELLGVEMVVTGSVAKFGALVETDIRVINVETGKIEIVQTEKTESDSELRNMVVRMVRKIRDVHRMMATGPKIPVGLTAIGQVRQVSLRWDANTERDLVGYKIYRSGSPNSEFQQVAKAIENRVVDTGLENGRTYYYKVVAFDRDSLESEMTSVAFATTAMASDVPGNVEAEPDVRSIRLTWSSSSQSNECGLKLKGYRIWRSDSEEGNYEMIAEIGPIKKPLFRDTKLMDGTTYFYRISAYSENGLESRGSIPLSGYTVRIPTGLRAEGGLARRVLLRWDMHPHEGVKGYKIYGSTDKRSFVEIGDITSRKKTAYYYQKKKDGGQLEDNATYYFYISAYNREKEETGGSLVVSAGTKPLPQSPAGLEALNNRAKEVILRWNGNPEGGIKEYRLFRAYYPDGDFEKIVALTGQEAYYVDKNLEDGTMYRYKVQAVDMDGLESPQSEIVVAITRSLPTKPSGLRVACEINEIRLTWNVNPEQDVTIYLVYERGMLGSNLVGETDTNEFRITVTKPEKKHEYQITAMDKMGLESAKSDIVSVTCVSASPEAQ
jgi:fibronectin type 3 domain-containing protein